MTNKQWRQSIYQYISLHGFTFDKIKHKELKRLLNSRENVDDDFLDNFEDDLELDNQL